MSVVVVAQSAGGYDRWFEYPHHIWLDIRLDSFMLSFHVIHRNKRCWHLYGPGETSVPSNQHSFHFISDKKLCIQ